MDGTLLDNDDDGYVNLDYATVPDLLLCKVYRPTEHIIGHIGSNDPTNSVKALKEDVS